MDLKQSDGCLRRMQVEWSEGHEPDLGKLNDGFPASWELDIEWFERYGNPLHNIRLAREFEIEAFNLPEYAMVVIEWNDEPTTYLYYVETSDGLELLAAIDVENPVAPCRS